MGIVETVLHALPLSEREAELLLKTAPSRYKVHSIEKRNGRGTRTIAQPTAEIKILQRLIVDECINMLPVHDAAKAYRTGLGILDHAAPHADRKYLLKLDFTNFFPSITATDFLKHLHKYSDVVKDDAKRLVRLLFWRPKGRKGLILSIGAPSSPFVSNTVMFDFDTRVDAYCRDKGVRYTRYADDLAFSTNVPHVLNDVHEYVIGVCASIKYPRVDLNTDKTVYASRKHHRQLTGLVLSNSGTASLGREKKRLLRAMTHRYSLGNLAEDECSHLRGWIAFALSIDKQFVQSLRTMVGEDCYQELVSGTPANVGD